MFYSPLRYPGGKNRLSRFVGEVCSRSGIHGHYVEPYAGGASIALYLLLNNYVTGITINDFDRSIFAFWHSVLNNPHKLVRKIGDAEISIKNWKMQKEVQQNKSNADLLELGFSTLFLNRTSHSGTLNGGVIGGLKQQGKYKINCRFNKEKLIQKIESISSFGDSISLYNKDALELVRNLKNSSENTIFYFDPPYYLKGPSLYMNHYDHEDHVAVSKEIQKIKNAKWLVSYDDVSEIRKLYQNIGARSKSYSLRHTAHSSRTGKEVLFASPDLKLPRQVV